MGCKTAFAASFFTFSEEVSFDDFVVVAVGEDGDVFFVDWVPDVAVDALEPNLL